MKVTSQVVERSEHLAAKAVERTLSTYEAHRDSQGGCVVEEVGIWWSWLFAWERKTETGTMTVHMASFVLWEIRVYMRLQAGPHYSKCRTWTSSVRVTWEFDRKAASQPYAEPVH